MNSPNYPPQGGQGPYGQRPPGQPYGQGPPQTPPGGQPYGGPPPQGPPYGAPPPQGPPYGAPPPQGQPYGGPPPGGFGPPGGPAGPGGPPPASFPPPAPVGKPSSAGKAVKIVVGLVVLAGVAVFAIINWGTSAASSNVGDCIKVNNTTTADVEKIDCNDPTATYKVAFTSDESGAECPTPKDYYVYYTETGGRGSDLLLCMTLNAKEGDCFEQGTSADTKVACTDASATFQVVQILTDTDDPAGCPNGPDNAYFYPEPKLVQCLGPVDGAGTT